MSAFLLPSREYRGHYRVGHKRVAAVVAPVSEPPFDKAWVLAWIERAKYRTQKSVRTREDWHPSKARSTAGTFDANRIEVTLNPHHDDAELWGVSVCGGDDTMMCRWNMDYAHATAVYKRCSDWITGADLLALGFDDNNGTPSPEPTLCLYPRARFWGAPYDVWCRYNYTDESSYHLGTVAYAPYEGHFGFWLCMAKGTIVGRAGTLLSGAFDVLARGNESAATCSGRNALTMRVERHQGPRIPKELT